jgi:hypothetical protein
MCMWIPLIDTFRYADVDHAVLPVTSGYRLVLTFNLLSQGEPQLAASLGDDQAKLCNLLASWARSIQRMDGDAPLQLVYILEHEYTQAGLRLDRLKGNDRRKVAYLKGACDEQKFCVCLAQLELSKVGGVDENEDGYDSECLNDAGYHELYEVCDTQLSLLKIYDIDGTEIATDVELSEEDVVQEASFEGVDPDDEDYSGPTGNEGVSATHFYHRTCVVILPRNRKINFLFEAKLKGKTDLEPWVDTMFQNLYEKPGDTNLVNDLESFCHCVIERNHGNRGKAQMGGIYYPWKQTQSLPDTTLSTAALVSLRLRSADVLERIAKVSHDMLLPSVYEGLGKIIAQEGLKKWEISLEKAFTCIASIRSHRDALYYVRKGFNTVDGLLQREAPDIDDLSTKIWEALLSKLDSVASVDPSGAGPLLEMASRLGEGALLGPIASLVEKHISQVEFVMSFLYLLKGYPEIDMNTLQQVHGDIHGKLAANFSIHKAFATRNMSDKPAFPSASGPRYRYDHRMAQTKEKTGATTQDKIQRFAVFLSQSLSWNLANNVFQIIDKIAAEVPHVGDFSIILIPFLRATALTDLKADESGHYQNLIRTTLTAYTERFVGMEPARPQDWTRPRAGCGCRNCDILGNWLTDPSQKQIRYDGLVQDPKRHLTDRLGPQSECRYEYDRSAKPQALVITKTQSRWEQDHREWSRRCTEAVKNINSIAPKPDLEHLLGSLYSPLLDLTAQRLPPNAPRTEPPSVAMLKVTPKSPEPRTMNAAWGTKNKIMAGTRNPPSLTRPPLQATTAPNRPTPPPTAGVKRPHAQLDIVDLT